jgi:hypothetical protein
MTTVWKIGDKVYGVHTEVENSVFTIYVTEEKIVEFYNTGGWKSEGRINGATVYSELFGYAYDFKDEAIKKAEKIAKEAEELIGNGWTKVVRVYPKEET